MVAHEAQISDPDVHKDMPPALQRLLHISQAMRDQAEEQDWQTVAALHARFSRLLPTAFERDGSVVPRWADTVRELIGNARWVSQQASHQREIAKEALRQLRKTAPAARAYATTGTPFNG